jgi:DNA-binding XRE family transcriptional regulator
VSAQWTPAERARVSAETFERLAAPVRAFPAAHHPVKVARVAAGLTQTDLAELARTSERAISEIERRVSPGSAPTQLALATALGTTREALFSA